MKRLQNVHKIQYICGNGNKATLHWFTPCQNITVLCGTLAYLQKDINKLQSVQRLACKICTKNWSAPYRDHLHILGIPTTCDCRMFLKLSTITRLSIILSLSLKDNWPQKNVSNSLYVNPSRSTHSLYITYAHTNSFMYKFMEWPSNDYYVFKFVVFN